jgi:hypothetical protein
MKNPVLRACLALALILGAAGAGRAQVTGRVVNPLGQGVAGVDVTFDGNFTATTGASGDFSIAVPAGTYDIEFLPPSSSLAPLLRENVSLSTTTNLGTTALQWGFELRGAVRNLQRVPQFNVDMNVYDQATGDTLFTPDDNTDVFGEFMVVVPAGTYIVEARPAAGVLLVARQEAGVVVSGNTRLPDLLLHPGVALTGRVVDAATQVPLAGIDLDVDDAVTGARIVTVRDNTDGNGNFSLVVPVGLLHVAFDPAPGVLQVGRQRFNVPVAGATNLGTIALARGLLLSGTVLGPGAVPLAGVDIDVDSAVGECRVYTPNDKTDASGRFSVVVPAGTYRVAADPAFAAGVVGARSAAIAVSGSTTVPTFNLVAGVLVSGTVRAFNGAPEAGVDLDVLDPGSGDELITPGDTTDAAGRYSMRVPTGTWNVRLVTRRRSLSREQTLAGIVVSGPRTLDHQLSLVPMATFLAALGVPTVPQGGTVAASLGFRNPTGAMQHSRVSLVLLDCAGGATNVVPPLTVSVLPSSFWMLGTDVPIRLPAVNGSLLGKPFVLELRFDDPVTGQPQDRDRFELVIE